MGKHSARGRRKKAREIRPRRSAVEESPLSPRVFEPKKRGPLEESPELPVHRERRKRRIKRVLLGIGAALLLLVVVAAVWAWLYIRSINRELQAEDPEQAAAIRTALTTAPESKEPVNMLLLGSDVRPDEEQARADTIILAKVDPESKRVWMISIPRDTRVEIPGHGVDKINAAHFLGGPALMIDTVEEFLGLPIHHYLEVDFKGFVKIVDALNGVYIDVDTEIDDWKAASHSKHHAASHIDPGYQLLDGDHALTYVRSRNFPDADFTRMRHQQEFFKALADQSTRWDNLLNAPDMIREFAKASTTDMTVGQLLDLARAMRGIGDSSMQTATLVGEWRSPYVWPDEGLKERLVQALLEGGDIETAKDGGGETSGLAPADVTVTVRNGGGIEGIAGQAGDILKAADFDVRDIGNANQFVYDETLVIYRDQE
ncbi:MAG: LCP family protein, partial [Coriobacteriia bacterium]|nr:LCP family protein [Coriobacteriia bacterium]